MINSNNKYSLLKKFFESSFSYDTRRKFAWWMANAEEDSDSEEAMRALWDECDGKMDSQTLIRLNTLKQEIQSARNRRVRWYQLGAVAAVAFLLSLTGLTYMKHQAKAFDEDEYAIVSAANGQTIEVFLEDSTAVVINSGSTLVYPSHFKKPHRKVFLIGEANFDVTADQERPFTVETPCFDVTALGTKFKVSAYSDARVVSTILAEGRTQVRINNLYGGNDGQTYELVPNQSLSLNKQSGAISIEDVNAQRCLSWENGNLVFDGADFNSIISVLERKFNVVFMCDHMEKMSGSYFVRFSSNESLEDILDILNTLSHNFKYRITPEVVYINPS